MDAGLYLGIDIQFSINKKYRIDTHSKVTGSDGVTYYAATIWEKVRSYWQPVLSGINLLDSELNKYLSETV